jgi:hypothetical protein
VLTIRQAGGAQQPAGREHAARLHERGARLLRAQQVEDVVCDEAIGGAVRGGDRRVAIDEGGGGAVAPPPQAVGSQRHHPLAQVEGDVRGLRRQVPGEEFGREPARAAAQFDDRAGGVEAGVRHEVGRGRVLVEALPVLGPADAVVDPAGLSTVRTGTPA